MLASRHILGSFKLQTTRKLFLPYVGQKRFLSTTNDDEKNFYEKHRKTIINATMVSGAALTFYGLGSFMWDVTFSLLNMSPGHQHNLYLMFCDIVLQLRMHIMAFLVALVGQL